MIEHVDFKSLLAASYGITENVKTGDSSKQLLLAILVTAHILAEEKGHSLVDALHEAENLVELGDSTLNQHSQAFRMYVKEELK